MVCAKRTKFNNVRFAHTIIVHFSFFNIHKFINIFKGETNHVFRS